MKNLVLGLMILGSFSAAQAGSFTGVFAGSLNGLSEGSTMGRGACLDIKDDRETSGIIKIRPCGGSQSLNPEFGSYQIDEIGLVSKEIVSENNQGRKLMPIGYVNERDFHIDLFSVPENLRISFALTLQADNTLKVIKAYRTKEGAINFYGSGILSLVNP
jgi:hypothetical protein